MGVSTIAGILKQLLDAVESWEPTTRLNSACFLIDGLPIIDIKFTFNISNQIGL